MAKSSLTKKIEKALFAWYPANFAGLRVDKFRPGFGATEVPVENGTTQSGIIDYARMQECFVSEGFVGKCKLAHYRETEPTEIKELVRQFACEEGCPKNTENYRFRLETCNQKRCRYYTLKKQSEIDTVIICVEIKITLSDFQSQHGHNFVGNANYYAMPASLYPQVESKIPPGIGVLLYYETEAFHGLRKKKESDYRKLSLEHQKWLICSIAKRNNKVLHQLLKQAKADAAQQSSAW